MASTRLPDKPLADIGGLPMVVRVARQAARAGALRVVVAADDARVLDACARHGVEAVLTRSDHATGSDRLAEACALLGLDGPDIVVNVQGDEPLIDPALIDARAAMHSPDELDNPNVVKVVLDAAGRALYFSRAPIPWWRDARASGASPIPAD